MHVFRACKDFRTRWNLEEDGRDNTPAPTKYTVSIATFPKVFREV